MSFRSRFIFGGVLLAAGALALWAPGPASRPDPVQQMDQAVRQLDQEQFEQQVNLDALSHWAAREITRLERSESPSGSTPIIPSDQPVPPAAEALGDRIEEDLREQLDRFFAPRGRQGVETPLKNRPDRPLVSIEQEGSKAQLHLKIRLSGPQGPLPVDLILQPSLETGDWKATELRDLSVGIKKSGSF